MADLTPSGRNGGKGTNSVDKSQRIIINRSNRAWFVLVAKAISKVELLAEWRLGTH